MGLTFNQSNPALYPVALLGPTYSSSFSSAINQSLVPRPTSCAIQFFAMFYILEPGLSRSLYLPK